MSVAKSASGSAPRSDSLKPFLPCGDPWHAPWLQPAFVSSGITSVANDGTSPANDTDGRPAAATAASRYENRSMLELTR